MNIILKSIVTCPYCMHQESETMPTNSCKYFYTCNRCNASLKAKKEDCCIYCSYGTIPCPPIQKNKSCCKE